MIASDDRNANLRAVYEQYWLHARHVENERLWFTNAYALIMAGLFAYMAHVGRLNLGILVFVFVLSLLGLSMTHALRMPFLKFSRMAERISSGEWGLMDYGRFFNYKKLFDTTATERSRVSEGRKSLSWLLGKVVVDPIGKFFSLHWVFTQFYTLASALTLGLIAYSLLTSFFPVVSSTRLLYAISVVCVVSFWAVLHFGLYNVVLHPRENQVHEHEENKLIAILREKN